MGDCIKTAVEVLGPKGWVENKEAVFTNIPSFTRQPTGRFFEHGFFSQNYTMFNLFAGFRAGEDGITPLAVDRGLLEDACDDSLYRLIGGWGSDKHWMDDSPDPETVSEKVAHRNDYEIFGFSWVGASELLAVDYGVPVKGRNPPFETTSLREALGSFYWKHLQQLIKLGDPDKVRVLFCFHQ